MTQPRRKIFRKFLSSHFTHAHTKSIRNAPFRRQPDLPFQGTPVFKEHPFLERFEAAVNVGFDGVEVLFPYDDAATEITRRLIRADLPLVLINTPPPNYTGGERGFAAVPGGEGRFRSDFKHALRYADQLKPLHIHIMAGKAKGLVARDTFLRNLSWAAQQAPEQSLTIEPTNEIDMPGYFLNDFELASVILAEVNAPNLGLQFDAYHAQIIIGDAIKAWETYRHLIRHIQVAGVPGRHEPDRDEIDYPKFLERWMRRAMTDLSAENITPSPAPPKVWPGSENLRANTAKLQPRRNISMQRRGPVGLFDPGNTWPGNRNLIQRLDIG